MTPPEFEWNEAKSNDCLSLRGFDFAYAMRIFLDEQRVTSPDLRWDYGEERFQTLGRIEDRVYLVVFTKRSNAVRIISARKANEREVQTYENSPRQS